MIPTDNQILEWYERWSEMQMASFLAPSEDRVREFRYWLKASGLYTKLNEFEIDLLKEFHRQENE